MKKKGEVWKGAAYIASVLAVVLAFLFMFSVKDTRGVFGYTFRLVVSGSMEPTIKVNTVNIIKICDIEDIDKDDIICYRYDKDIIHRVIDIKNIDGDIIINTQGDANEYPDGVEITEDMVIGKVVNTLNWSRWFITKFSSEPGKIDGVALVKSIITNIVILTLLIVLARRIIDFLVLMYRAFFGKDYNKKSIAKLNSEIKRLNRSCRNYRKFNEVQVENVKDSRLHYIANRILKARTEFIVRRLEEDIKEFNSKIRYCIYIDKLVDGLEVGKNLDEIKDDFYKATSGQNESNNNKNKVGTSNNQDTETKEEN